MRAMSPAELKKELDALASLAIDRLVAAPDEDRLRLLFRYSPKSQLCILLSALKHLKEARRRMVALNARIGTLEWNHRVELEVLRRGIHLPEPAAESGSDHLGRPEPVRVPAVGNPPAGDISPANIR